MSNTHRVRATLTLTLVALWPTGAAALDAKDVLFYHSFDQGATADFSRGDAKPSQGFRPLFAEGVIGHGLSVGLKPEHTLRLPAAGNLDAREGTLSFWVRPVGWDPNDPTTRVSPAFLRFGGQGVATMLYFWGVDNNTKFLMFAREGTFVAPLAGAKWTPGFNHFAVTWRSGEMTTYQNGRKYRSLGADSFRLPPQFSGNVEIGQYLGDEKGNPGRACSVLDELYFLRRALDPEEIRMLYVKPEHTKQAAAVVLQAGQIEPAIDGRLGPDQWQPAGLADRFVDRLTGRIDEGPAVVRLGHGPQYLYLAATVPVPSLVRDDSVHYPRGAFSEDARQRDGAVRDDDCWIVTLRGGDGALYEFAVNPAQTIRDARNGDPDYRADVRLAGHADQDSWTLELAIPWSAVGFTTAPRLLHLNVRRRVKTLGPGFLELVPGCEDEAFAQVELAAGPAATVSLGPGSAEGAWVLRAAARDATLELRTDGKVQKTTKVAGSAELRYQVPQNTLGVAEMILRDPTDKTLFRRAVPYGGPPQSRLRLVSYPGAGVLVAVVDALQSQLQGLSAKIALVDKQGRQVAAREASFQTTRVECELDVSQVAPGSYTVRATVQRGGRALDNQSMPFERKPLPVWCSSKAGIVDSVPPPWIPMTSRKKQDALEIGCWGRMFLFRNTFLPAQISAAGGDLLAAPIRVRMEADGREQTISNGDVQLRQTTARRCEFRSSAVLPGGCPLTVDGWIEYDGLLWFDLEIGAPGAIASLDRFWLELPLRTEVARLIYNASYTGQGTGVLGHQPRQVGRWTWVGDSERGIQWCFPSYRGWAVKERDGQIDLVPGPTETVVRFRLLDRPVKVAQPRRITLGLHPTPVRPMPRDLPVWRFARMHEKRVEPPWRFFSLGGWGWCYPNYPAPREVIDGKAATDAQKRALNENLRRYEDEKLGGIACRYMFGPYAWIGSPEYAQWYHEWAYDRAKVDPDPRSDSYGGLACPNSSAPDLVCHLMQQTLEWYALRGLYFDCTGAPSCSNRFHGCGYVDEQGHRQPEQQILGARRYHERIYTLLKAKHPEGHICIHCSGLPQLAVFAFADSFAVGEQFGTGLRRVKGTRPQDVKYFDYPTIPWFRAEFQGHNFGVPIAFLPEFAPASGNSPESRNWWYAEDRPLVYVQTAPAGQEQLLYRANAAVEHLVGMALVHDTRLWATYAIMGAQHSVWKAQEQFGWDADVRFVPYWNLQGLATIDGGVPEKVVVSLYHKPGRVLVVPFNDTDQPAALSVRLSLERLGVATPSAEVKDIYRWQEFEAPLGRGRRYIFRGARDTVTVREGILRFDVPPRSFRMLAVVSGDVLKRLQ